MTVTDPTTGLHADEAPAGQLHLLPRRHSVLRMSEVQMAELADNLHELAGIGYTIVAVHAIQRRQSIRQVNAARLACESVHRAIRFAGARLLQTFQLDRPAQLRSWLGLHQLYALAEGQQLSQLHVEDELSGSGTIATAPPSTTSTGLMPSRPVGALPMWPSMPASRWNTTMPSTMPRPAARKPYW